MMNTSLLNTALFACLAIHQSRAFSTCNERRPILLRPITKYQHTITLQAKHYGPPSEEVNLDDIDDIKSQFTSLLHNVMSSKEEDIPSLLTTNIDTILKAMSERDLLEEIMEDEASTTSSTYHLEEVSDAVNTIITFVESFVEEASQMEKVYKKLLGRIFKLITPSKNNQIESEDNPELSIDLAESELDNVLAEEKEAFTPGFLRHLEGECERIGNAKDVSPESTRMLQILRLIQTRVLEELGKGIGEGAIMLGQLLGYDSKAERLAVLDAGLTVRGVEFAMELSSLTSEALEGFQTVKDVDPGLVKSIEEIDERIGLFMEKNKFQ